MKWTSVIALCVGIILGALGASLWLHVNLWETVSMDIAKDEELVDIGTADFDGLFDDVNYATTTPLAQYGQHQTSDAEGESTATSSRYSAHVPTIVYHSVRPYIKGESVTQDRYDVTPELLEKELQYISEHGYHSIDMRDLDAYWKGATSSLPEKAVMLTFDDGWRNQYTYAFPLLKKYHMKAVFYIYTNPIDHKKPHWMSWDEVREIDRAGMEIGGHTRTHPILTKISEKKELDHEILEPKLIIEKELGHSIISFAYPFGMKNTIVEEAVTRAGYHLARTVYSGVWDDPTYSLELHGTLSSDRLSDFIAHLNKQ